MCYNSIAAMKRKLTIYERLLCLLAPLAALSVVGLSVFFIRS